MPRFNVDFSDETLRVLEDLAKRHGSTKAEVLRRAVALEKWFEETRAEGSRIVVERPDGHQREVLKF